MKKSAIRVAAATAVVGLFATMAPMSAFAANTPSYDPTTDGPIYLMNGTTATDILAGTQLDWNFSDGVILTAIPVTASTPEASLRLPAPSDGALTAIPFLSAVGSERTKSAWKAYGDSNALNGVGVLEPAVWPGNLGNGTGGAAAKASGGTFSMGIAYLKNADLTVVKAYYTTINVDPGGNWTFATPVAAPTDVTTTTTLAASLLTVEAGQTTTLTATVSATPAASGNVEFFEGAASLGTIGLAGGTATKIVTVSTEGPHTYSAKFVTNTVGANHFLGSTSTDVTVTGTAPSYPLTPDAPSENALDASNKQLATYSSATDTAQLGPVVGAADGTKVHAFGYSTKGKPMYLGEYTVGGTVIVANVSGLPKGLLKVAAVDELTHKVLAWGDFTKSTDGPSISKTINANVAILEPTDGEFSISNLSGQNVTLTNPTIVGGKSVVSGKLGDFQVTDLRRVSKAGWDLKTTVTDFTKGTDTIDKSALGIDPKKVSQLGSGATEPTLSTALVSGSAVYPWTFASLAAGGFSAYTKYNADLTFTAPAAAPAGTYSSTLTLTLISK